MISRTLTEKETFPSNPDFIEGPYKQAHYASVGVVSQG